MADLEQQTLQKMNAMTDSERAESLFCFLRELNKLKQHAVLHVREYKSRCRLADLPADSADVELNWQDRQADDSPDLEDQPESPVLLKEHRPEFEPVPRPDAALGSWLQTGWDSWRESAEPLPQREYAPDYDQEPCVEYFEEDAERVRAWERWLPVRSAWAERQEKISAVRDLFSRLYSLYFELKRETETEELIIAAGMLRDRQDPGILHPVLTRRVRLEYDADENTVAVRETDESSELYSALLQSLKNVNLEELNLINEELHRGDYHPMDRSDTPVFLKMLVRRLSEDSAYYEDGLPDSAAARLELSPEPCLILRKRQDGAQKAIESVIEHIRRTGEVPAPIRDIVSGGRTALPPEPGELTLEEQLAAVGGEDPEILLCKEANREQLEIARRLQYYNAVLG